MFSGLSPMWAACVGELKNTSAGSELMRGKPRRDIARKTGVSLATVDRVLNDRPAVTPATHNRVYEAVSKLGYVRDLSAASLNRRRHYKLAFALPEGGGQFHIALRDEIASVASRAFTDHSEISSVSEPENDPHALLRCLANLRKNGCDGVTW